MMDPVPLDEDIVKRFAGKTMAIVGYETDQVQIVNVFIFLLGVPKMVIKALLSLPNLTVAVTKQCIGNHHPTTTIF